MAIKDRDIYFAAREPEETAGIILSKANKWFNNLDANGYLDKLREMWAAYHGAYYSDIDDGHRITFGGEQGELANLPVNHFRNICKHILVMITSTRPALDARAVNTDYKSQAQTILANGLLDYYMRDKRLEDYVYRAVEYAIVLGSGYVKMEWDATSGELFDMVDPEVDELTSEVIEPGYPIYEGDVNFTNLSPFDVVVDSTKENEDHEWILTRSFKNRFDLAAKYPELEEKILKVHTKEEHERFRFHSLEYSESDDVPVYELYHKRTKSMTQGRYLLFLDHDVILMDAPMPYDELPIYRISPSMILGTPYGYTELFDLLPLQDAVNSLYSTIMSNQNAFGVQNILMPRGTDINPSTLVGGLNLIEYNAQLGKPEPLNLTQTPKEIFEFIKMLVQDMETLSGVNSVARGNPEASLNSGAALALVQSTAIQYISGLQQSYVKLLEDVGTGLISMLQRFASVPRIAMIAGKKNKTLMKEFTGDDLDKIRRVIVDVGNPLARCLKKGTEVLMYDGSKEKVENIRAGDLIMGPDSKSRTVESVNSGKEMMYDIHHKSKKDTFLYGCNESHILTLRYCSDDERYNVKKGDILDISVRDYLKLPDRHRRILQGFRAGVDFEEKSVGVPPYILGLWLGDGHSATTALTTMDSEILKEWSDYAASIEMQIRISTNNNSGRANIYFITSGQSHGKSDRNLFMNELRSMEVINNKHIPHVYLKNNEENRLQLLAGLIDTDGSMINETFVITQKNDRLSQDIVYLAQSLGFRTTTKKVPSQLGPGSNREYIGECNKITIGGDTHRIPTRLPRKQAKKKEKYRNWLNYGIRIKPIGTGEYYGFTLKEEPHFLLGDFTVTHNTTAGRVQMADQMIQMGVVTTPEQYISVINTGELDNLTENTQGELLLIKAENEKLISGESVIAVATEQHSLHIKEHKYVLSDPDLKHDPDLVSRTLAHINEHINLLRTTDPALLTMMGEQPLGPMAGSPPAPGNVPGAEPTMSQGGVEPPSSPEMPQMPAQPPGELPEPARPPAPFENAPISPGELPPQ